MMMKHKYDSFFGISWEQNTPHTKNVINIMKNKAELKHILKTHQPTHLYEF